MFKKENVIKVDINNPPINNVCDINFNEADTNTAQLVIVLLNKEVIIDLTNCETYFTCTKGLSGTITDRANILDAINGKIGIDIPREALIVRGQRSLSLILHKKDNEELKTVGVPEIFFNVTNVATPTNNNIRKGDEYPIIDALIEDVETMSSDTKISKENLEEIILQADDFLKTAINSETDRDTSELERKDAFIKLMSDYDKIKADYDSERIRIANEQGRALSEIQRIENESLRQSAETKREEDNTDREQKISKLELDYEGRKVDMNQFSLDEKTRQTTESERIANEEIRLTNETTRVTEEEIRQAQETVRVKSETDRISKDEIREDNEANRVLTEQDRKSNELTRKKDEKDRLSSEDERTQNESLRVEKEKNREKQELTRRSNEERRIANEQNRESVETIRNQSEEKRKNTEGERVLQESIRISQENSRKSSESTRITNEDSRNSNESTRSTQETTRQSNESDRSTQETTRQSNETNRINTINNMKTEYKELTDSMQTSFDSMNLNEKNRNDAENIRISNESMRIQSESNRIAEESKRATNETARQSKESERGQFEAIRQSNEVSRVEAESSRTLEYSEFKKDYTAMQSGFQDFSADYGSLRTEIESAIVAETGRASKETERVTAETSRASKETERVTAETSRASKETERVTAETGRASKETERVTAETSRASKEMERVTAETDRASKETERVTAETKRAEDHIKREEFLNSFESQLETIESKNVEQDTRLNKVEYTNKRQDVMLNGLFNENNDGRLSIEGEGNSVKLENSKNGVVEVNSVKGNTLVNIVSKFKAINSVGLNIDNENITIVNDSTNESHIQLYWKKSGGQLDLLKPNTTYTIIANILENTLISNAVLINSWQGVAGDLAMSGVETSIGYVGKFISTFKTVANFTDRDRLGIIITATNKGVLKLKNNILILEGDYTNKPIPQECFEGMQSSFEDKKVTQLQVDNKEEVVANLGKYKANVSVTGKNKYKPSNDFVYTKQDVTFTKNGDVYNAKGTTTGYPYVKIIDIGFLKTGRYRLSLMSIGNKNGNTRLISRNPPYITYDYVGLMDVIELRHDWCIEIACSPGDVDISFYNIQLEELIQSQTTPTQYEPYKEFKQSLYLNEPLYQNNEVCINEGKLGYWKNSDKVVLDGSDDEIWVLVSKHGNATRFDITIKGLKPGSSLKLLCNRLILGIISTNDLECINIHAAYEYLQVQLKVDDLNTYRENLKSNPLIVIYELATPIFIPILEDTPKWILEGFNDCTVTFNSNIPVQSSSFTYTGGIPSVYGMDKSITTIEEHNVDMVATSWDMDYRLLEMEWVLEDITGVVFNLNNIKTGGKNMALSRFEQAKIMIIGGAYDKATLTKQLNRYLEKKILTQTEYDELIALMEAKELVVGE